MKRIEFQSALKSKGVTMQEAAEALGITRRTLYNILEREGEWNDKFKTAAFNLWGIEYKASNDDLGNPNIIHKGQLGKLIAHINNNGIVLNVPFFTIKDQVEYTVSFGDFDFIDSLDHYALPPGVMAHGAIWRYWEIEGESMEPTFHNKDIILTSQVNQHDWENVKEYFVYVIVTEDKVMIKRVYPLNSEKWVLISDNEDYFPQQLIEVHEVKELWVFRRHINSRIPVPKKFHIKFK